jgi:CheY-like chemotaxis protein
MWVESVLNQGSTFYFTIMVRAVQNTWQDQQKEQRKMQALRGKKLLIVEDNATHRQILNLQSQSWGMQPHTAESGKEALKLLQIHNHFDLAILDMQMPEMDGLTLAQNIRTLNNYKSLPLIMLSSISVSRYEAEAANVEFAAILNKPIKQSQLHDILAQVVSKGAHIQSNQLIIPTIDPHREKAIDLKILLAEDNLVNQKVALHMLQRLGYQADVAINGLVVLELLEQHQYDVILMDLQMPKMDGLETTKEIINRISNHRRPRIIAMTANAMEGDRQECLRAGMDDYITKPVKMETLAKALSVCQPLGMNINPHNN